MTTAVTPSAAPPPITSMPPEEPKLGFIDTVKTFPKSYFMGCQIEMFERLAYYGVRQVVGLYIAQADDPNGLHFTQAQKGTIFFWWALVQSLVPMVSGGLTDRYGYKKTIALSVLFNMAGYSLMGTQRSYAGFFLGCLTLAFGTAIFKPGIQGTLAQSMSKKNSSLGWGAFYWLVNIGAFIGPLYAAFMRGRGWPYVFAGSVVVISLNLPMLLTYKEVDSGADKNKKLARVVYDTFRNILDARLVAVIILFSGFWMMLYQLWDLMPLFYTDWVDSGSLAQSAKFLPESWIDLKDLRGPQIKQEIALNLNAFMIVFFVVPMSFLVRRLRVLKSISIGVMIATLGTVVYGTSPAIAVTACGVVLFSIGEMLTGPKKTEYFSLIAPAGKKALYLGYVNIPVAIGQAVGAKIAGWQYGSYGEKAMLSLRYLAEKTQYMDGKPAWNGDVATLEAATGVARKEAFATLVKTVGQDGNAVNQLLWDTYKPYQVWYVFSAIGLASLIGILTFSQLSKRWKDMNV